MLRCRLPLAAESIINLWDIDSGSKPLPLDRSISEGHRRSRRPSPFGESRMKYSLHIVPLASVITSALLIGTPQASAVGVSATPAPAPELPYSEAEGSTGSPPSAQKFPICIFRTRGDNVHISSSAFEASGHGWWVNYTCDSKFALVKVQLQQYYSDGSWRNIGTVGAATVKSGGGAGNRATGRAGCLGRALTGWRSVVSAEVIGLTQTHFKLTTPGLNIPCRR